MIVLVGCGVYSFEFLPFQDILPVALVTKIEVKTVVAFVPHILDWHLTTPVALNILLNIMSRLDNDFNPVFL